MKRNKKDFLLRYATLALTSGIGVGANAQDAGQPPGKAPQGVQILGNTTISNSCDTCAVYGPPAQGNTAKNAIGAIKGGTLIQGRGTPKTAARVADKSATEKGAPEPANPAPKNPEQSGSL